ncbi:MAG: Tm-1-like ATP-binding domain-containing protein [Verrucomicrobiales bacterium]
MTAGPSRLAAAGAARLPAVVAPGCVDMVNFGARDSVPAKFSRHVLPAQRTSHPDADHAGRMRRAIAGFIAAKLNAYPVRPTVALPLGGVSVIAEPGGPFHDPEADRALFRTLKAKLDPGIEVVESALPINHPEFARLCAERLLAAIAGDPAARRSIS